MNNSEYFLSINEVSTRLSVPAHTLRYWEKQFPAAVKPTTGAGGRRYYRPETVAALESIRDLLYNRGMTIAGVKKMIKDGLFSADSAMLPENKNTEPHPDALHREQPVSSQAEINGAIALLENAIAILN